MVRTYETCSHIVTCLYKIDYANEKRLCSPACTEQGRTWKKGTKREKEPQRITDLIVRKKLASRDNKGSELSWVSREETRVKELNSFDPSTESQREINSDNISHFFRKIQLIIENAVLFKSNETLSTKVVADFS